jgi:hypothetical protein
MRYVAGLAIIMLLFLIACSQEGPVCSAPYTLQGGKCCLDANNDSACDTKAVLPGQLDCSLCPPQFVTEREEVIVYRYVCPNQSIMEKFEDCAMTSNAYLFNLTTTQDERYIEQFSITPACRGKFQAGEIYLKYAQAPRNITLQLLDDPAGEFKDVAVLPVKPELYSYVSFCRDCQNLIDVQLKSSQAYAMRAALEYEEFTIYTNELIVDPTAMGEIGKKVCS